MDDFATIQLQLSGVQDSSVIVQLLDKGDKVVRETTMAADGTAKFNYVMPATYYVRAFADRNGNRVWDTGRYDDDLQPEDVYYYHRTIEAKAKWDIKQQWNLTSLKRNAQKPDAIVKQKPDKEKKKLKNRNLERAKNLGIEYIKEKL